MLAAAPEANARVTPKPMPAASPVWVGTFTAAVPATERVACADCAEPKVTARGGSVVVLTPSDGAPVATGEVVVVQPLLGAITTGHVEAGRLQLPWFVDDVRDSDDGVLVLPAGTQARLVAVGKPDDALIRAALMRDEALSGIKRALLKLEIGAIDVDGDGRADFAVTYGCTGWADGSCQSRGQFFLARHGVRWDEIE